MSTISKQAKAMTEENSLDEEVNQAYIELVGKEYANANDAEEAYCGRFDSDIDFAMDLAEQLGSINAEPAWPYTCIDWEHAARELMYDYSEQDHYYFRDL